MNKFTLQATIPVDSNTAEIESIVMTLLQQCKLKAATTGDRVEEVETEFIKQRKDRADGSWQIDPNQTSKYAYSDTDTYTYRTIVRSSVRCSRSAIVMVICRPYDIDAATIYAHRIWPEHLTSVYTITSKLALGRVHGWKGVPFTFYNYPMHLLHWYKDVEYHERAGRIVRVTRKAPETEPA